LKAPARTKIISVSTAAPYGAVEELAPVLVHALQRRVVVRALDPQLRQRRDLHAGILLHAIGQDALRLRAGSPTRALVARIAFRVVAPALQFVGDGLLEALGRQIGHALLHALREQELPAVLEQESSGGSRTRRYAMNSGPGS
jgi:hypothetical protein